MKAGWCDFRYIANRPQHFRPPHNRHRLVTPGAALRSKLGYEQYRKHSPERTEAASENTSDEAHKRPKTVLADKIGYDQFRPDVDAAEVADSLPAEHAKTRKRRLSRAVHNHGLGANRAEIVANCEQFASRNVLALSIIFSPDPGLLAVVDASGNDPQLFNQHCVEAFLPNVFSELGWGNAVEYAYVTHDKPDRLGRSRLHNHITAPGSVADPETGKRRPLPYIKQTDIQQMQAIADRTVEQQLDLTLGREWRLQVPEYVHTYDELRPEDAVDNALDMPVVVSESVPPRPRDLFSSELDNALNTMLEKLPDAPTMLFDARDLEFDSFGDAELLAGLVADLFGHDFLPPMMPIQSAAALPAESNKTDESNAEPSDLASESPSLKPFTKPSAGLQTSHLAITLASDWLPELGLGAIQARTEWLDPATGKFQHSEGYIYQTSVMDHIFFYADRVDFDESMLDAQSALETQLTALQSALAKNHDQGICDLYKVWFETMALDAEAIQNGFLPDVPRQLLPDTIDALNADWTRLPGVKWVYDAEQNVEYGFTAVMTAPDENEYYTRQALRRWTDDNGVQQVDIVDEVSEAEPLEVSVQMLWATAKRLEHDFADASLRVEQQLWRAQFDPLIESPGVDLNEVEDFEYEADELEQGGDDSRDM